MLSTWWGQGEDCSNWQVTGQPSSCINGYMEAQALVVWPGPVVVQWHVIPKLWSLQLVLHTMIILAIVMTQECDDSSGSHLVQATRLLTKRQLFFSSQRCNDCPDLLIAGLVMFADASPDAVSLGSGIDSQLSYAAFELCWVGTYNVS